MRLSGLLAQARQALAPLMQQQSAASSEATPLPVVLFFSLSDGKTRAHVCHRVDADFETAWMRGAAQAQRLAQRASIDTRWLRIDWVTSAQPTTWAALHTRLAKNKRNYFRYGLAPGVDFSHAFLEQELNANAMLYAGVKTPVAKFNENNFNRYAKIRYGEDTTLDYSDGAPVTVFSTQGLFVSQDKAVTVLPGGSHPQILNGPGRNAGRRAIAKLQADDVKALIVSASEFLTRQVRQSGQFVYGHFPSFGRRIRTYNTLRHASTIYAMVEAWELTQDAALLAAIQRSLGYLMKTIIQRYPQPDGTVLAFNVDINDEIKLGANAVSILALVKYTELTQDAQYQSLMEELALGIVSMQCQETGRFNHVLNASDLSLKEAFRIIYYDGEAAFGLMRLYGVTKDPRWLEAVEKAFDYFIEANHWEAHDHWLSYCANELTLYRPEEKYFRFGVQNIADHLDFIHKRLTTYPTLLELSMAFHQMLERLKQHPDKQHVLDGLDTDKFYKALHHRAHYLLNGFFWPELAMYYARPSSILGSFFIRHHAFRVRIDDVEHYLSGYVAYWKMLAQQQAEDPTLGELSRSISEVEVKEPAVFRPMRRPFVANWTAGTLARSTQGHWQPAPEYPGWHATGVSFAITAQQPGHVIMVRADDSEGVLGVPVSRVAGLPFVPQAVLAEPDALEPLSKVYAGPILMVESMQAALEAVGYTAREKMAGPVIGITGSAGKTTACALLSHVLQPWGQVGSSRLSANTLRGLAWNMASMPWNSDYFVLEMAIAGMARSSRMVRPQVAVVTNIGPAHLQYHGDTKTIAQRKAAIFDGMEAGGHAIINIDMAHADIFLEAADKNNLRITRYSQSQPSAELAALTTDFNAGRAMIKVASSQYSLELAGLAAHTLDNILAVLGVVHVLDMDITHALHQVATFQPRPGRGARVSFLLEDRQIRLIDESYNANPLSMQAALQYFQQVTAPEQGVLLLGDMLELDDESATLHEALVPYILAARPRIVALVGEHVSAIEPLLKNTLETSVFADAQQAWDSLASKIKNQETVLIKGSNATGLNKLVRSLSTAYGT